MISLRSLARLRENNIPAIPLASGHYDHSKATQVVQTSTSTRPRIWMIISTFFPVMGGAQVQVHKLSHNLLSKGWPVQILTRRHHGQPIGPVPASLADGMPIHRLYSRGISKVGALCFVWNGIAHLLRFGRRDIYHAHDSGASAWLAILARYLLGGQCLIKLRTGTLVYERYLASPISRLRFKLLIRLADRVIVVNSEVEDLLRSLGTPNNKVVRIPNSVDTDYFRPPTSAEHVEMRRTLGFARTRPLLLYVGRLDQAKGVDVLLDGWSRIPRNTRQNAVLAILGDGPHRQRLERRIQDLSLRDSVVMAGMKMNTRDYYWAADIFVLPSRTEGLSNSMIEAMACGLPVVASRVGGARDLIEERKNGFTFSSEQPMELSLKLSSLLTQTDQWATMGSCGRHKVREHADLYATISHLQTLYEELS